MSRMSDFAITINEYEDANNVLHLDTKLINGRLVVRFLDRNARVIEKEVNKKTLDII